MALEFEWDQAKARTNLAKHGVSFESATSVFRDAFALAVVDDREDYGEERILIIGMVDGQLLSVIYTERSENIRIISARRASPYEQQIYNERARNIAPNGAEGN